jgi:hypothetical protein
VQNLSTELSRDVTLKNQHKKEVCQFLKFPLLFGLPQLVLLRSLKKTNPVYKLVKEYEEKGKTKYIIEIE